MTKKDQKNGGSRGGRGGGGGRGNRGKRGGGRGKKAHDNMTTWVPIDYIGRGAVPGRGSIPGRGRGSWQTTNQNFNGIAYEYPRNNLRNSYYMDAEHGDANIFSLNTFGNKSENRVYYGERNYYYQQHNTTYFRKSEDSLNNYGRSFPSSGSSSADWTDSTSISSVAAGYPITGSSSPSTSSPANGYLKNYKNSITFTKAPTLLSREIVVGEGKGKSRAIESSKEFDEPIMSSFKRNEEDTYPRLSQSEGDSINNIDQEYEEKVMQEDEIGTNLSERGTDGVEHAQTKNISNTKKPNDVTNSVDYRLISIETPRAVHQTGKGRRKIIQDDDVVLMNNGKEEAISDEHDEALSDYIENITADDNDDNDDTHADILRLLESLNTLDQGEDSENSDSMSSDDSESSDTLEELLENQEDEDSEYSDDERYFDDLSAWDDSMDLVVDLIASKKSKPSISLEAEKRFQQVLEGSFDDVPPSLQKGFQARLRELQQRTPKKSSRQRKSNDVWDLCEEDQYPRRPLKEEQILNRRNKIKIDREPVDLKAIHKAIRNFICNDSIDILPLHSMDRFTRKVVHKLAKRYNVKSKDQGSGYSKYTVLKKTPLSCLLTDTGEIMATKRFVNEMQSEIDARIPNFSRKDYELTKAEEKAKERAKEKAEKKIKGKKKEKEKKEPKRRKEKNGTKEAKSRNGMVVGEHAAPLNEDNPGFRMLAAMGWNPGQRLGVQSDGILEPISAVVKHGRLGLGAM